jgi:hypothetical protein
MANIISAAWWLRRIDLPSNVMKAAALTGSRFFV